MSRIRCSYSPKQLVTIRDFAKKKMVVHSGPFGVGKTRCLVEAFGIYCQRLEALGTTGLTFVLVGRTQQAAKRNMCNVLAKCFGRNFRYFKGHKDGLDRDAILFGQNIYIIGFSDVASREKFQGITDIMGILQDECTLCDQEQFDYAMGRLRGEVIVDGEAEEEDAEYIEVDDKLFTINLSEIKIPEGTTIMWYCGSCNPDKPDHFIKRYITEGILENIKWYCKDAIWKGAKEQYVRLKRLYRNSPSFYSRYIDGKWTSSDSMVYTMFQPKIHILKLSEIEINYKSFKRNFIAVDYGSDHPTAILLISVSYSNEYIVSKECKLTKTAVSDIVKHIADFYQFLIDEGSHCSNVFVDPSAGALKDELRKNSINYMDAMNGHDDGINCIRNLLALNKLFIIDVCENLISEMFGYSFKPNKSGKDEVVKLNDDFVDAERYGIYTDSKIGR